MGGFLNGGRAVVTDANGVPYSGVATPAGGHAISAYDPAIHVKLIRRHLVQATATSTTLTGVHAVDATVLNVADTSGFAAGNYIQITQGLVYEQIEFKITAVGAGAPGTLTLDGPLENAYTAGATVTRVIVDANVTGSLAAPQIFEIGPPSDEIWRVVSFNMHVNSASGPDDSNFCGIAALANGLVVRQNNTMQENLAIWKDGGEIRGDTGPQGVAIVPRVAAGQYSTSARWHFLDSARVSPHLVGASGHTMRVYVQDDLSTLDDMHIYVHAYVEPV